MADKTAISHALAFQYKQSGAQDLALACYEHLISINPDDNVALREGCQIFFDTGQWTEASIWAEKIVARNPEDLKVRLGLASAARQAGRYDVSERALREGLYLHPGNPELLNQLGWTLRTTDRYKEAEESFRAAIALEPNALPQRYGLIAVLQESSRTEEAEKIICESLKSYPEDPSLLIALASVHKINGDFNAEKDTYLLAVEAAPDRAEPWTNLELTLGRMGLFEKAMDCGRRALELDPHCAAAHLNLAMDLLRLGRFSEGWIHYQWRFPILLRRNYPIDPIPGNPLIRRPEDLLPLEFKKCRITLVEDQGLGDELSFLRFAPLLRARGAHVTYMPDPRIAAMVDRAQVVDKVAPIGEDAPVDTQLYLACGDMPLVLGLKDTDPMPPPVNLVPLKDKVEMIRVRLRERGLLGKRLVGLTWRGGRKFARGIALFKEAPLDRIITTLESAPVEVLILQRKPSESEMDEVNRLLGRPAHDFTDLNEDLEAMLALLDELEDYVTVSNTNVHLRVGLRKPCRVLVPNPPDYRWMISGDTSPWFPGARVYRQCVGGDWSPALDALATDLQDAFQ